MDEVVSDIGRKIGEKFKKIRKEHGYSLIEVGEKINFNYSNLSKIERGVREPYLELIEKMAKFYNVSLSYFFGPYESKEMNPEWIEFVEEMKEKQITPDEIKTLLNIIKKL